jgi:Na+/proline symporter
VHDFYRRFVKRDAGERHYVLVARITTALLMITAALMTFVLTTAKDSFDLILSIGAGTGLIYILRWFWWRINAWSEIAAMIGSFVVAVGFFVARKMGVAIPSHVSLIVTVATTSVVWLVTTYLATPTDRAKLLSFYSLVRPAGPGWRSLRAESGLPPSPDSLTTALLGWIVGCFFVYAGLFGTGSFIYGRTAQGLVWLAVFVAAGLGLIAIIPRLWKRERVAEGG